MNYYHTPYLVDLIRYASIDVPDFSVQVPENFRVPGQWRYSLYIPGSAKACVSTFGESCVPFCSWGSAAYLYVFSVSYVLGVDVPRLVLLGTTMPNCISMCLELLFNVLGVDLLRVVIISTY